MRPRKRATEQERRDLIVRQGELTALSQHTGWPVLAAVVDDRVESYRREAANALMTTGMTAERQAFIRGFLKGMDYVLAVPGGAEASLEQYLRRQRLEMKEEAS